VLRKLLPKGLRTHFRREFRRLLDAELPQRFEALMAGAAPATIDARLRERLPCPQGFMPRQQESTWFMTPKCPTACAVDDETGLPVPPPEARAGYGPGPEQFLASGKVHVQKMRAIVAAVGFALESSGRILEFGCAGGRMLRWLHDLTATCEVWGADIWAGPIHWCKQYLSPPFHFVTNTTTPHLPFEDHYFGFLFAGSVFTHLDEIADAWFYELRRVVRPGGQLYITIHDQHTLEVFDREPYWWIRSLPEYAELRRSDFRMFTIGQRDWSRTYVFYDTGSLCRQLEPFFRVRSVNEEAYGYQTALLLERR
jgi:ubiquinone/menaquinone biosynthesis C-methylase UbiE